MQYNAIKNMAEKSKIIYLITQAEWGGAQRYVFDLGREARREFDILSASGTEGEQTLIEKFNASGVRTLRLKHLVRDINPWKDLLALFEIRKILKRERPNILHLNSTKAGVLGSFASFGLPVKVVYTVHGWAFLEPLSAWKRTLYFILEKLACLFRDATILLSEKEMAIAKKNKLACGRAIIIKHGIDVPVFKTKDEARQILLSKLQHGAPRDALWIGTAANFYAAKDIPNLLHALSGLEENFFSIIIGDGPEQLTIKKLIHKLKLNDRVALPGRIEDAAKLLTAFDLFVLPSAKEGFPYVILETMAAGLPIIATTVGALPEMIENKKSGLLVPPKNPETLRAAIISVIKNENLRTILGKNAAMEFNKKFSKEKMISSVQDLYNQLLLYFV